MNGISSSDLMVAGLASLALASLSAPLVLRLLVRLKSQQTVSVYVPEHAAKQGTPTMGGILILIAVIGALALARPEGWLAPVAVLLGFGLVGFLDDYVVPRWMPGKRGLGWMPKLGLEIGAVLGALAVGSPAGITSLEVGIAVFFVLFFCNAYNFADGLDGLAGSLGVIMALSLLTIGLLVGLAPATLIALVALAAAFVPFLMLNAPPARVFMGDIGALPIGALLGWAVVGLLGVGAPAFRPELLGPLFIWSGVMVLELVPVPLQILSVKLRKGKRLFPRTPIHHAFQHAGWPETRVTAMFVLTQLVLALLAVGLALQYAGLALPLAQLASKAGT